MSSVGARCCYCRPRTMPVAIRSRRWIFCCAALLATSCRLANVDDPNVLYRCADGGCPSGQQCLEDYCPHRGARLSRGEVLGDNIACRYHGVTLDGSGTIVRVPAMPDCALDRKMAGRIVELFLAGALAKRRAS